MSVSTVSATNIQDPSGQVFANGTWRLEFVPTYGTPGIFNDGGLPFTKQFGGSLDATGSFSQAGVARSDTIAPAGSQWRLYATPAVGGVSYQVLLNVNSPAFDATASINAVVTNIIVSSTAIARAYKDAELINADGAGAIYYDETLKVLKTWDAATGTWLSITPGITIPTGTGFVHITAGIQDAAARNPVLASSDFVNQGSVHTVLHGNAAGNPSFGVITSADVDTSIALTGVDINTSNQVISTHLTVPLPSAQGGTGVNSTATFPTTGVVVTEAASETLTSKRVTPRQIGMADAASVTPTSDTADINTFVSTQVGGTLTVNAPTGTPTDGQKLTLRLKSTNAQTYSFNATYAFSTSVTAPTTLAAGKTDYIGLMWNATNTKWDVVAVDQGH